MTFTDSLNSYLSIPVAQQEICQMHYPDAVYVSGGELVECHDVFGIVVFYLQEIGYLAVGLLRQLAADLDIYSLVTPHGHEVSFLPIYTS